MAPRFEWHAAQPEWTLYDAEASIRVPVAGRLKIDSAEALRRAAASGLGIAMLPAFLVERDLRARRLVEVLPDYAAPERPLHVVYLRERQTSPKLRCFIDFVVERFGADAGAK